MTLTPFDLIGEEKAEEKIPSPKRGNGDNNYQQEGLIMLQDEEEEEAPKRRSCERRLFVPTSPEKGRVSSDGALGSSLLRSRYEALARYYYRPNPDGIGGSVGSDNEDGEFVPAPGTWLVNSRLEIISYPIPGMFSCGERGGVYIVEEDDEQNNVSCRHSSAKDEGFESSVNMLDDEPVFTNCRRSSLDCGVIDDPPDDLGQFKPDLNSTLEMSDSLEELDYAERSERDLLVDSKLHEAIIAGSFVTKRLQLTEDNNCWRLKDSGVSLPGPFSLSKIIEKMEVCYPQSSSDESEDNNSFVISEQEEFQTGVSSSHKIRQEHQHIHRS